MIIFLAVAIIISAAVYAAAYFALKKKAGGSIKEELDDKVRAIQEAISANSQAVSASMPLRSKAQYETLLLKLEESKVSLSAEKENLKQIESKLVTVQKNVEAKEVHHQEMKTSKEEDDAKLSELLAGYESISQESIELEQKLAESMKSLDAIMDSIPTTNENQKAVIQELSDTLTNAGSRMRDLLTEYNLVKERLDALNQQHIDLEEEYTRLVEQQLGE